MSTSVALLTAKEKLLTLTGDDAISFEDLPQDRLDPDWGEIKTTAGLSMGECAALKNAVYQGKFSLYLFYIV